MNGKKAKRLRREAREKSDSKFNFTVNLKNGERRWMPDSEKVIYKALKKERDNGWRRLPIKRKPNP